MNIQDAYDYLDLLLDKANQPYFQDDEKDKFINMSITEFLNSRYALMRINQDYSEIIGNRYSATETTGNVTASTDSVTFDISYLHLTNAVLNGVTCKIVSDDEFSELTRTSNPFKSVDENNPICAVTQESGEPKLFFNNGGSIDFTSTDEFSIRFLSHLTVSEWEDIPEHYQHDILKIVVRKMTANIENPNYQIINAEQKQ